MDVRVDFLSSDEHEVITDLRSYRLFIICQKKSLLWQLKVDLWTRENDTPDVLLLEAAGQLLAPLPGSLRRA